MDKVVMILKLFFSFDKLFKYLEMILVDIC